MYFARGGNPKETTAIPKAVATPNTVATITKRLSTGKCFIHIASA